MYPTAQRINNRLTTLALIFITALVALSQMSVSYAALSLAPKSIYVSAATGKDTDPGTQAKPYKTLKKALSVAVAGDTVMLAAGKYGKSADPKESGDVFPMTVPAGVAIVGANTSSTIIHGNNVAFDGLKLIGSSTIKNLTMADFHYALSTVKGQHSWSGLSLAFNYQAMSVGGTAKVTLVNSPVRFAATNGSVAVVAQTAQLTVDGGIIDTDSVKCTNKDAAIRATDSAQISLVHGVQIRNVPSKAFSIQGASKLTIDSALISKDFPADCEESSMIDAHEHASLDIRNTTLWSTGGDVSSGIKFESDGALVVMNSYMDGFNVAVTAFGDNNFKGDPTLKVIGTVFRNNSIAIYATSFITVRGTSITGNFLGIIASNIMLRNSVIEVNNRAMYLRNPSHKGADLGTITDPGGNTILGSTGIFIEEGSSAATVRINAVGNTWKPNVQGSDAFGRYNASNTVTTPYTNDGGNYRLPAGGYFIQF